MTIWIALGLLVPAWLLLTRVGKISGRRAHELVASGAQLVDVRTPREFFSGHLPDAMNVPLDELRERAPMLAGSGKPVVIYCQSGVRSAAAKRILRAAGLAEVYDLGAMTRW